MNIKIINSQEASENLLSLSDEFVIIKNPDFIFPGYEVVPLAKKIFNPENFIAAVMDMDGTTTTTEELCVESLEFMIRKMSGLLTRDQWIGLNEKDYPNVIGNSTTKHVEYLINTYRSLIKFEETINSFVSSIIWTLRKGRSEQRKNEVKDLLKSFDIENAFENFLINLNEEKISNENFKNLANNILNRINLNDTSTLTKIGIEIYYQHYHQYLLNLSSGQRSSKKLIEPLPGVAITLSLIKGLLGEEAEKLSDKLIEEYKRKNPQTNLQIDFNEAKNKLKKLGTYFESNPVKTAVVTSSIFYEADIVLTEVFDQIKQEIKDWNISSERKEKIINKFSSYQNFYDAVVTATDAYEFRLKPHRDLYSIALHKLGISKKDFSKVIGFEDSQCGTIAIRAAGIGCCIAVPFPQTSGHDLQAASYILWNGLPEFVIKLNCLSRIG
ncbi:MAG: HAD family phosphatase [Ignavibacteria bacterium]|nr:HAD family phosphatase [Ignavibacteria bacterium]